VLTPEELAEDLPFEEVDVGCGVVVEEALVETPVDLWLEDWITDTLELLPPPTK
jgi:hypothetical protein